MSGHAAFALLDDCEATAAARSSRLCTGFVREHRASLGATLEAVSAAATADVRHGLHAVVLASYEFGREFCWPQATDFRNLKTVQPDASWLRFLIFTHCEKLSRDEADAWLAGLDGGQPEPSAAGVMNVAQSVTENEFTAAIAAVHAALREGESYQINYTYRLGFDVFGSPVALYRRLRQRQPVRYGALIALPDGTWVVSCSPELLVAKRGARLWARPMKGTIARAPDPADDARAAIFLANDAKNRAENVMIVDLLRNDLSKLAKTGSVKVPALFSIERYPSMWHMTSTVEATARTDLTFAGVLRALFPCGSITGAPKYRTMQLIDALETTPRGLYTGAIGWLDAPLGEASSETPQCGDFCLSVAIRTLELAPATADGLRRGTMGAGGGIVLDSVATDEYAECRLKARFLTQADPGFQLFETMHATREAGVRYLGLHLERLGASARQFGFVFDEAELHGRLDQCCAQLPAGIEHRLRVTLTKAGQVAMATAPLIRLTGEAVGVMLAPDHGFAPVAATDPLLAHKTTRRAEYDRGWREAEAHGGFDMLFFNERGELTEGGRSNVFVQLDERWWTPPLSSGVLPGVMRRVVLADASLQASERVLVRADLRRAQALMVCNALRGVLPARLMSRRGADL